MLEEENTSPSPSQSCWSAALDVQCAMVLPKLNDCTLHNPSANFFVTHWKLETFCAKSIPLTSKPYKTPIVRQWGGCSKTLGLFEISLQQTVEVARGAGKPWLELLLTFYVLNFMKWNWKIEIVLASAGAVYFVFCICILSRGAGKAWLDLRITPAAARHRLHAHALNPGAPTS